MPGINTFERTELRVLKNLYPDDEVFLDKVADQLSHLTKERDMWKERAELAEARNRILQG